MLVSLCLKNKIEIKKGSYNPQGIYYQIQFGNVKFYRFLLEVGLFPNKSKNLGRLNIPKEYFSDFLREYLDGDGFTYSYWDKRWKNSFMLYTGFTSASSIHLNWLKEKIEDIYSLNGILKTSYRSFQLLYAKKGSIVLLKNIYYKEDLPCLKRKQFKIKQALGIIGVTSGRAGTGRQACLRCMCRNKRGGSSPLVRTQSGTISSAG